MFDVEKNYSKDTIGYHWRLSRAMFGKETRPTKWLEQKARESSHGMDEKVIMPEPQVVQMLGRMWLNERDEETLERMKETPPVKLYNEPIDPNWLYEVGEYQIAYIIERHPLKDQYQLSISRKDKEEFSEAELLARVPSLFHIFEKKAPIPPFSQMTEARGFVMVYII